ncbi:MAG: protein adenylyltransferase SelO [Gemmatimonadales bacterium]
MKRRLADLQWDNSFSRLPEAFYQRVQPTPLAAPRLVAFNPDVAELLDLDAAARDDPEFVAAINGERPVPGTDPLAALYAGYQFGVWVPQLGDGRAILLGEVVDSSHQRWDIQLKGAGLTQFSRMGDGRAVLRSAIREYLAGEAMHGLGIPTTRSLAILGSDEPVYRESVETGAILVRVAPTHVRFGSFEVLASRGMDDAARRLADYVIEFHFPHLLALPAADRYGAWYRDVVERTARLMAAWTAVGFTHGVMNTDNMSITGATLDYGPYAWMEGFEPGFAPNHSDPGGRYGYDQQPLVGMWNCARLGEALTSLMTREQALEALDRYRDAFTLEFDALFRAKLGLRDAEPGDPALVSKLLALLHTARTDYTRFFRALAHSGPSPGAQSPEPEARSPEPGARSPEFDGVPGLTNWLVEYHARLGRDAMDPAERNAAMLAANPKYVLRTWMAQEAVADAQSGNFATIERLRRILRQPFAEQETESRYAEAPPDGAPGVELSCSS